MAVSKKNVSFPSITSISTRTLVHALIMTILLQCTGNFQSAHAFPGGAGHCQSGDMTGKFSGHGENGGGTLSNGSLQVKFGAYPIQTYTTRKLNPNQQYSVTVDFSTNNAAFFFRGLLFRLSGKNGEDVSGTFSIGGDSNVQLKRFGCDAKVSAVTHTNRDNKVSATFNFEYTESEAADLLLEVTVVRERAEDNWFYSSYNLQITPPPSSAPSRVPTVAPVVSSTSSPSDSPVMSPLPPSCDDSPLPFKVKRNGWKKCTWVAESPNERCALNPAIWKICPETCGFCHRCVDSTTKFKVLWNGSKVMENCKWVADADTVQKCKKSGIKKSCRNTCGLC